MSALREADQDHTSATRTLDDSHARFLRDWTKQQLWEKQVAFSCLVQSNSAVTKRSLKQKVSGKGH